MPLNFAGLSSIAAPKVVGQVQGSSGGDLGSGLSSLASGLGSLKSLTTQAPTSSNSPVDAQNPALNLNPNNLAVNNQLNPAKSAANSSSAFKLANQFVGLNENSPAIKQFLQKSNPGLDPSSTAWCAGYMNSVLEASGVHGTGSLAAKSFLKYGTPTDKPTKGDIVILNRGNDPSLGHVGFYNGTDQNGNVLILGGNQGNSVSVKAFSPSQVAGYRIPPSGQQVQDYAKQNNISDPRELSNQVKAINQRQEMQQRMVSAQAAPVLPSPLPSPASTIQGPSTIASAQGNGVNYGLLKDIIGKQLG